MWCIDEDKNIPCEILGKPNNTPRLLPINESSVYQITNSQIGLATTDMEINNVKANKSFNHGYPYICVEYIKKGMDIHDC